MARRPLSRRPESLGSATPRGVPREPAAHSPNAAGRWHPLADHLKAVSSRARRFGEKLGAGEWTALAGLWHDLGKYHPEFQQMLQDAVAGREHGRVDHSSLGALHAELAIGRLFETDPHLRAVRYMPLLLTATIAGHHAGLADDPASLAERLRGHHERYAVLGAQAIPPEIVNATKRVPPLPPQLRSDLAADERALRVEFLVRMVLSALVDGDRLDTEAFAAEGAPTEMQPSHLRSYASVGELRAAVDRAIDGKAEAAGARCDRDVEKAVHDYRQTVLAHCRLAADEQPGAFTLDVSTGGGKTLASLSFALRHAEKHRKDRVIVVIPFTSIVEQTADAYRKALGSLASNVLEHHSAVSDASQVADLWEPQDPDAVRWRMATENWDPPLIVTTGVQFFESLFSASASRCRKLHNIANSVVVIDEAQTLPPGLLNPTVWAMNQLVDGYAATLVLSTATQPSLEPPFPEVRNKRPIVPATVMRPPTRVRLELVGEVDWPSLASQLAAQEQVLCITHQRKDARELTEETDRLLGTHDTVHLSAAMCPEHRSAVLRAVHSRLTAGWPCRVVSTQLVEAGVDLDFPMVYRAVAGIDSLVQAAGRANREGRLGVQGGVLRVFRAPTKAPPGLPRLAADATEALLRALELDGVDIDLFGSDLAHQFFRRYFGLLSDKDGGVTPARREFRFREVERRYRFIDDDASAVVVVPYDDGAREQIGRIQTEGPSMPLLRSLQRYSVTVYRGQCVALLAAGRLEPLFASEAPGDARRFVLQDESKTEVYHPRFGLLPERVGAPASGAVFA